MSDQTGDSSPANQDMSEDNEGHSTGLPYVKGSENAHLAGHQLTPALEEMRHAHHQQRTVVSASLCFALVLFLAAIAIVFCAAIATKPDDVPSLWHISAISSGFLVAGSVIVLVVVRAVHPKPEKDDGAEQQGQGLTKVANDLASTASTLVGAVADLVKLKS